MYLNLIADGWTEGPLNAAGEWEIGFSISSRWLNENHENFFHIKIILLQQLAGEIFYQKQFEGV